MPIEKPLMNKEQVYRIFSLGLNLSLIAAALIFVGYLIAPLLGGIFFAGAVIRFASWILVLGTAKITLSRMGEDGRSKHLNIPWLALSL
jgi:hypothetical protein